MATVGKSESKSGGWKRDGRRRSGLAKAGEDERVDGGGGVDGLCAHAKGKDKARTRTRTRIKTEDRGQRIDERGQRTGGQRAATRAWRRWVVVHTGGLVVGRRNGGTGLTDSRQERRT
jgi:hypothetical protein